eukprot:CAMPEP_0173358044 /NCGR_PEP_ID=MMETSP1144-20121109/19241_1 /TAXON_ID=483371 /ORGANISM="non described non described, Strain CCMP2298" /LENGTH=131 /DNA_ID=CAMNT_0014307099 /DNA_START=169 /DNA_END=561 /DNA_ORIENTATION=-
MSDLNKPVEVEVETTPPRTKEPGDPPFIGATVVAATAKGGKKDGEGGTEIPNQKQQETEQAEEEKAEEAEAEAEGDEETEVKVVQGPTKVNEKPAMGKPDVAGKERAEESEESVGKEGAAGPGEGAEAVGA